MTKNYKKIRSWNLEH